jgi:hypothetical protein
MHQVRTNSDINIYSSLETSGGQSSYLYLNVVNFFQHQLTLIRHLWQLKTVLFLHWCLICAVLLQDQNLQNVKRDHKTTETFRISINKSKNLRNLTKVDHNLDYEELMIPSLSVRIRLWEWRRTILDVDCETSAGWVGWISDTSNSNFGMQQQQQKIWNACSFVQTFAKISQLIFLCLQLGGKSLTSCKINLVNVNKWYFHTFCQVNLANFFQLVELRD